MTIAATRMHRLLVDIASKTTHVYDEFFTPPSSGSLLSIQV